MPELVGYLVLFLLVGVGFILVHLLVGKLIRPAKPHADKLTIYECGEPTIGSAWVQFDVRYYVVALLFVIFDVEVAFFFPWAIVFGNLTDIAKPNLDPEARAEAAATLVPQYREEWKQLGKARADLPEDDASEREGIDNQLNDLQATALKMSWISFVDIGVFFGVLLVGFAYLWKRGDLNWVRSTAAELPASAPAESTA